MIRISIINLFIASINMSTMISQQFEIEILWGNVRSSTDTRIDDFGLCFRQNCTAGIVTIDKEGRYKSDRPVSLVLPQLAFSPANRVAAVEW